jgi:hypothetical protein
MAQQENRGLCIITTEFSSASSVMTFLDGKILFSKDGLKNLSSLGLLYNVNLTLFQQEGRPWLFLYNPNGLVASLQQMECSRSDHE